MWIECCNNNNVRQCSTMFRRYYLRNCSFVSSRMQLAAYVFCSTQRSKRGQRWDRTFLRAWQHAWDFTHTSCCTFMYIHPFVVHSFPPSFLPSFLAFFFLLLILPLSIRLCSYPFPFTHSSSQSFFFSSPTFLYIFVRICSMFWFSFIFMCPLLFSILYSLRCSYNSAKVLYVSYTGKGKVHPITCRDGTDGE